MSRIKNKFREIRKAKRKAFIAFITAGYPDLNTTKKLILEFDRVGVDIVEIGVPFSDPMADGPLIQEASEHALRRGVNLEGIFRLVKKIRLTSDIPVCLMTYYNPIFCFGEEKFLKSARSAGVDGVIVPDLPPEEGVSFRHLARRCSIDVICFISPTTSRKRISYIAGIARGFIYYVSLTGVTGERKSLPPDIARHIKQVRGITDSPVCVGFGISSPEQVRYLSTICDGVIVGSAIIKKIKENIRRPQLVRAVGKFVSSLRGA